jgi:predicted ATP-grasp superfamily ATP-dependent carboligase
MDKNKVYWVGNRESEITACKDFFDGTITFYGGDFENNRHFINDNRHFNYNIMTDEIYKWLVESIYEILLQNTGAKFYFYASWWINGCLAIAPELKDNLVMACNSEVSEIVNNKFTMAERLAHTGLILDRQYIFKDDFNFNKYRNLLNSDRLVVQQPDGAGGSGTFLVSKDNHTEVLRMLASGIKYSVAAYQENNVPINIHVMVYDSGETIYPASVQNIITNNHQLTYRGADFIAYHKIPAKMQKRVKQATKIICQELREMGYRGVAGIDFVITGDKLYFMEINGRFQNSTVGLNLALTDNGFPTLHEQYIELLDGIGKPTDRYEDMKVNYSNIVKYHRDAQTGPSEPLYVYSDGYNEEKKYQNHAYLYNQIYNKSYIGISHLC